MVNIEIRVFATEREAVRERSLVTWTISTFTSLI